MPGKSARASLVVAGVASAPTNQLTLDQLTEALKERAGNLINEAADLGEDGHYRNALRKESTAGAILDVLEYIRDGEWPETQPDPTGDSPSDELAERYEDLVEADA